MTMTDTERKEPVTLVFEEGVPVRVDRGGGARWWLTRLDS